MMRMFVPFTCSACRVGFSHGLASPAKDYAESELLLDAL